jgi:hypothetical protein
LIILATHGHRHRDGKTRDALEEALFLCRLLDTTLDGLLAVGGDDEIDIGARVTGPRSSA